MFLHLFHINFGNKISNLYPLDKAIRNHIFINRNVRWFASIKEIAIDTLAHDLSKRLEDYLFDDGSNVLISFERDIKNILTGYFGK